MHRSPLLPLPRDEAHLWTARPEQIADPALLRALAEMLSPEEKERWQRFLFERDRHSFLVTRALVRTTLSRYAEVDPRAWTFAANPFGKPEIAGPMSVPPLRFNVSHTHGLTGCLVARDRAIGWDVEDLARPAVSLSLAERYFAPAEVASLRHVAPAEFMAHFLDIWTLKEAYIKALGKGLAQPLADFAFHIAPGGAIHVQFGPGMNDTPANWQFVRLELQGRHKIAVALRRQEPGETKVILQTWSP